VEPAGTPARPPAGAAGARRERVMIFTHE